MSAALARLRRVLPRQLQGSLVGNAALLTVALYGASGIGLLTHVVAIRLLSAEQYGAAALLMSFPTLVWTLASFKPSSIVTRYLAADRAAGNHEHLLGVCALSYLVDGASALLTLLLVLASAWYVAPHMLDLASGSGLMALFAASFLFTGLVGTSQAILAAWQLFWPQALLEVVERLVFLSTVIVLCGGGWGAGGLIVGALLAQILVGSVYVLLAARVLLRAGYGGWWRVAPASVAALRGEIAAKFGWNYVLVTLTGVVAQLPVMVLGAWQGPQQAGYYRLAAMIATAASYGELALARGAYPALSAIGGREQLAAMRQQIWRWTLQLGLPASALVAGGALALPLVVPLVFSGGYAPMVLGLQAMMVAIAARTLVFWINPYFYATGQIARFTKAYVLFCGCVVAGSVAGAVWGFLVVCVISSLAYTLFLAVMSGVTWVQLHAHERALA